MTEYSKELVERMVALVRDVDQRAIAYGYNQWANDARAIVAELPAPIDPDILRARRIADEYTGCPDGDGKYSRGERDSSSELRALLAAIKQGRELERSGS